MQIVVKPEQGKYYSVDELLAVAFQLLEQHDLKEKQLSELRRKLMDGTQQLHEGKVVEGELVFQQLQEKLK